MLSDDTHPTVEFTLVELHEVRRVRFADFVPLLDEYAAEYGCPRLAERCGEPRRELDERASQNIGHDDVSFDCR